MSDIEISRVVPMAALPGGEVRIEYRGEKLEGTHLPAVKFDDFDAEILIASSDAIVARVPESSSEEGTSNLSVS